MGYLLRVQGRVNLDNAHSCNSSVILYLQKKVGTPLLNRSQCGTSPSRSLSKFDRN